MANHAHLLIAICDDEIDNDTDAAQSASAAKGGGVGTAGVVAARRRGPTVGLAPTNHYLIMPHGGPALHIHARRENHSEPPKNCTWRFLQARSALPPGKRPSDHLPDNDAAWQKYALTLMARVASNLQQFNEEPRASDDATHKEMCKRLTFSVEKNEKTCFAGELRSHNAQLFRSLKRLAALRRGSSDVAIRLAQESDRTIFWLFGCTLLAALLWESFTHWHPQSEELASDGKVAADLHAAGPQDSTAEAKDPTHKHGAQALVGGLSIILAVAAIGWFWIRRGRQFEEHSHDYRAISEGARVQFYWQLAGLGKSTSSHYLNRQRSELDWIRGAIRSMSLPYERARECFGKLAPEQQIAALRCVLHAWIEEQYEYFKVKSHQNESQLHRFHHLGKLLALTGVALAVVLIGDTIVAAIFSTGHPASMKSPITWMKSPVGFRWLVALDILIALVWPAIVWAMYYQHRPKHQGHRPKKSGRFEAVLDSFLAWYLPSGHDSSDLQDSDPSPNKLFKDFLFYLPSMAILAFTSMVVIIYATEHWLALPPTHDLQIIIAGALLIFGAMSVAWAERHSCSELAYRYRAMLSLFENARAQIAGQIEQLQQLPADSADYARLLDGIQRAIRELGIEALDENAEWLILHRARPLEPVMAG
jgi:hypothetical protein